MIKMGSIIAFRIHGFRDGFFGVIIHFDNENLMYKVRFLVNRPDEFNPLIHNYWSISEHDVIYVGTTP